MPVRTHIESFEHDINLIVRNDLAPAAQSAAIAKFAQAEFQKTDDTNRRVLGRLPPHVTTVDGRPGAPLESVNPNRGTIITEWDLMGDVLVWIGETLIERSPVVSGRYKRGHQLFADGQAVPIDAVVPKADRYLFINTEPYARKIEVGKTKAGRDFVIQVPNRIYERTANEAHQRFGNIAKITFTFQSINGGAIGAWAGSASANRLAARVRRGNPATHHEWLTKQPAILVQASGQ